MLMDTPYSTSYSGPLSGPLMSPLSPLDLCLITHYVLYIPTIGTRYIRSKVKKNVGDGGSFSP